MLSIRNIAIIAHVDHGKTTLTDALLKETGTVEEGFSMDSNALEQERGITIYAKNTSLFYKGTKINIVDTPGHADFSSEVERVLRSVDAVLLLVDAQEGPMPQTRFVLKKSLECGLKPLLIINKIDKPAADPKKVLDDVLELFIDLGASDEMLNFPVLYAIGREGVAMRRLEDERISMAPLLEAILETVPDAGQKENTDLSLQVFNLGYDNFLGRLAIGRIYGGELRKGMPVLVRGQSGALRKGNISSLFTFAGTKRQAVETATSGDIVMFSGIADIYIGETIVEKPETEARPSLPLEEPTISLNFLVNDSPFAGREGKYVTGRQLKERLERELETNVGLRVDFGGEVLKVSGRGELHISILLETMRREGYEMQVSQPEVIIHDGPAGKEEPYEEVVVDVENEHAGRVVEALTRRKGALTELKEEGQRSRIRFEIPTRGLLGYRSQFVIDTRGLGILASRFMAFRPWAGTIEKRERGAMTSMTTGMALAYALFNLEPRGTLYIKAGTEVYEGMVIGNTAKGEEMGVNPTKGKQLTNMRASGSDEAVTLTPPYLLTIERGLELMSEDEYLEITPQSVRLRKRFLTEADRVRANRGK